VLNGEITHRLNRASAALAALHSYVAQLVHTEQGITSVANRTRHKDTCRMNVDLEVS
jgi:hydroxymethylglutaryl-CoA reductase